MSSCSDDEVINQSSSAPLQVSVSTQATMSSRAIIHDEYLPDASNIGISLFTPEFEDYDNQGYLNVKYTASGTGESQTWAAQGTTPSISANEACLLAYYPYNPDVETIDGLAVLPVENASQTDYMYAGLMTGITNANPKVNITMQHALTAIRINLVLGDFTGDATVSNIAVKSPGLASAATLDIYDGMFNNISGSGDEFAMDAVFALSASGTANDVLFVPDAAVTEGTTTVSATIGGKKYTAGISFDNAYQQGYIYTYTLTLNNSGFLVTKVAVEPWKMGADDSVQLEYSYQENDYIVQINVPSDNYTYTHNIAEFEGIIDWGDGSVQSYEYNDQVQPEHVYDKAGEYIVRFTGKTSVLYTVGNWTPIITEVIYAGDELGISDIEYAFYNQSQLAKVPEGLFDSCNNNVTTAACTFYGCSSLQTIPADLFDDLQHVTDFSYTFMYSGLKEIPEGLFDKCTEAMYWGDACLGYGTFQDCDNLQTIPAGLFNSCTKTTLFPYVFSNCDALQTIPDDMFNGWTSVQTFEDTFKGCENLSSVGERAFANCPSLLYMKETFISCTGLNDLPGNMFEGSQNIKSFNSMFRNCTSLQTIPEGLFDSCTKVTSFSSTFMGCSSLQTIPVGLFDNCPEVTIFNYTFYGCSSLQTIPEGLFDYNTEVTSFAWTFENCDNLQTIPEGLFDNCTEVTSFSGTFNGCNALTGESPYTVIQVDGVETRVHLYERSQYPEHFTVPTSYSSCFYNCTGLTDYSYIPSGWK